MKNPFETFCPVPRDQRPFYQYLRHKEFFGVGSFQTNLFKFQEILKKFIYFLIFSVCSFFIFFLPQTITLKNCLEILFLDFNLLFLFYLYTLINYKLISNQLFKPKVLYEESTWFDINTWVKPVSILRHERLINEYQFIPFINRLKNILMVLGLIILLNFALLNYFY